ncbi:hypothetical protein HK405_006661 [Cladochytrium tenue]|nr:hypothetical protein HK405_006661 [Cladochytrium tenue]
MTSTSEPTSTAKTSLEALPPPYSDGVTMKLNKQQNETTIRAATVTFPEYIANPSGNEATHMLVPIPTAAAGILNSQDRSWRRRKRVLFFTIVLLALYFIYRRRIHYFQGFHSKGLFPGYEYPPEGLIPEDEFEDPVPCAAEASTPVYPENRLITIPGDASKFALTVLGVGMGEINLEIVDDLVDGLALRQRRQPRSDPVLVAGLAAVTCNGGVAVSGPATIAGSADGHIRLESQIGSIRVVNVDVASEVPLSVGTNSGSIFLEGISADCLVIETNYGTVTIKNITLAVSGSLRTRTGPGAISVRELHGAFIFFNISTYSGPISVSEVSRNGAATSTAYVLLASGHGPIDLHDFDLGPNVTVDIQGANGVASVKNLKVGSVVALSARSGEMSIKGLSGTFHSVEASSQFGGVSIAKVDLDKSTPVQFHVKSSVGPAIVDLSGFVGHFEVCTNYGLASVTGSELHFQRQTRTEVVGERGDTGPHVLTVFAGRNASAVLTGDA